MLDARHRNAPLLVRSFGEHRDELTDPHTGDVALDREVDRDRLIAVGKSRAAEDQAELLVADLRGCPAADWAATS